MTATLTTQTPRNHNEGGYKLEAVKPDPEGSSRYALARNHEGWPTQPAEAIASAYRELALEQIKQATPTREEKAVALFFVSRQAETGEVVRVPRGRFKGVLEFVITRTGKFGKAPKEKGGALLD